MTTPTNEKLDELVSYIRVLEHTFLEAKEALEMFIDQQIKEAVAAERDKIWAGVHTRHEVGDVVGYYEITERFRRVGKNTKYRVICTICREPMFRYSNKFKLHHKDCPAHNQTNNSKQGESDE